MAAVAGERNRVEDGIAGVGGGAGGLLVGGLLGGETAEHVEQVGEGIDGAGGGAGVGGDLFDAEVDGAAGEDVGGGGVAQAGYEVGVGAERELEAEEGDVVGVRAIGCEGQADVADAPGFGENGDVVVAGGEERGAGGGDGAGAGAVEHGVDLFRCGHVGGGEDVVADLRDAEVTARSPTGMV